MDIETIAIVVRIADCTIFSMLAIRLWWQCCQVIALMIARHRIAAEMRGIER